MIENIDLQIKCGADFMTVVPVYDENDELRNLSGYTAFAQIRETAVHPHRLDMETSIRADYGAVILKLSHEKTETIAYNRGVYDIFIVKGQEKECVAQGYVIAYRDVTKIPELAHGTEAKLYIYDNVSQFPAVGSVDRIYLSAVSKSFYRWNGSEYIPLNYFYSSSQSNPYLPYELFRKHAHTGTDDTGKIDYQDLKNKPFIPTTVLPHTHKAGENVGQIDYNDLLNKPVFPSGVVPHVHNGTDAGKIDLGIQEGIVGISHGGTGANSAEGARNNLGITGLITGHNHDGTNSPKIHYNNIEGRPTWIASIPGWWLDLIPPTNANHGGHIDFHFNGNPADYTSRIIEVGNGILYIQGVLRSDRNETNVGLASFRQIWAGTEAMTPGVSALASGAIYLQFE